MQITNSQGGANFAVYAPAGSVWSQSGTTFTSDLNGRNYWSIAMLPAGASPATVADAWQAYAHVHPTGTAVSWSYDPATAVLRTVFTTAVTVHEGAGTTVVQGLLPHQWAHLAADAPALTGETLPSIRGELKLVAANTFATEREFRGILPTLPATGLRSPSFDPARLQQKVSAIKGEGLAEWTDSYNEGQVMNRLVQTARIAHETGDWAARDQMLATVKARLEDWLTHEAGEVAFLFHYSSTWTALLGYPAGHGQDTNLNDHQFHWGYFIHAAAFVEQFQPGWADQWGPMVELLIRDAASPDRADPLFPFLRNFSPFAGHAWANGFATFPFGNDQESTSESMQFNSALIHWGAVTGNDALRDLGIYLYTTEQSAVEEYWLDVHQRNFKPGYGFALASRVWGNGYDNQTFWTGDVAAAYGIELYPIHGGSLYLGHNLPYARRLWAEMSAKTGILSQAANPNLWHDIYWQFQAFTDPAGALELYAGNPDRELKFGVSDAQTYYWLHALNALGEVDATVSANDPLAAVFSKNGVRTYVANNYGAAPRTVAFSDGATLLVPAGRLVTSLDAPFSGTLATPFAVAPVGGTVGLTVTLAGDAGAVASVELYDGTDLLAPLTEAPYAYQTAPLCAGRHTYHARLRSASGTVALTGLVTVAVGEQLPFAGLASALPGTFEAGAFDRFEGGNGNGTAYFDASPGNNGDYRPLEDVDAAAVAGEGATVGWIDGGEWLEYTVQVAEAGLHEVSLRFASNQAGGGGPFHFELAGERVSPDFTVPSTGGWGNYQTALRAGVELPAGRQALRLVIGAGGFNLGKMTFARTGPLAYVPPVADAGADAVVAPEVGGTTLNGAASTVAGGLTPVYLWEPVFGPARAVLADAAAAAPQVTGLYREGLYRFALTVDDGTRRDRDEVEILVGTSAARPPPALIFQPGTGARVVAGQPLTVSAIAEDADGTVARVEPFSGSVLLASRAAAPYDFVWWPPVGTHRLTVRAVDSDGLTGVSSVVEVTAAAPGSCRRVSASGDFEAVFSPDAENPTVTFVPSRAGVGAGIVIFYPGAGGVIIQPNTPYRFTAAAGQTVGYYFTYSVPEGGERNSLAENASFTVGAYGEPAQSDPALAWQEWAAANFSAGERGDPGLEATRWGAMADPDGDAMANYLEFAVGGDPLAASPLPLTLWPTADGSGMNVRYARRAALPGGHATLQWSVDLRGWSVEGLVFQPVSLEDGVEVVEAALEDGRAAPGQPVFWRLRLGL